MHALVIIGGGGHALVVAEAALAAGLALAGFVDDDPFAPLTAGDPKVERLGGMDQLSALAGEGWVLGVGDLEFRRDLLKRLAGRAGARTVVHPRAAVSPSAVLGEGVFVGPGAVVHTRARVRDHAIINCGAVVEHECTIGPNAHIAPNAALAGRVSIGADTLVGLGAAVLPGISVGARCVVGAGAVVTSNVQDDRTAIGAPASARVR